MSYSASSLEEQRSGGGRRTHALALALFLAVAAAFLLRFAVSPQLMNLMVDYTNEGGVFYEKLHFGTDAIFLMLVVVFIARPIRLEGEDIRTFSVLLRYSVLMALMMPYLVLTGRAGSSGFIIDTYLVASAAGLIMLAFDPPSRRALGDIVVAMILVSATLGIIEAVTQHRILPYGLVELQFRPIGLTAHPLALGALCATGIGFVAATRWRIWVRILAILLLFIGCAASGARFALLMTIGEILMLILFVRWPGLSRKHEWQSKGLVLLVALAAGAVLAMVMFSAGLLNRFEKSIFDENFMARVTIYQVFDYVSWKDMLFGMKVDELLAIVNQQLHLPAIESAVVVIVLLFGLPLTMLFAALVAWMMFRLLKHAPLPAWIGTITFMLAALSNNTLSSKTPEIAMLVMLLIAYGNPNGKATSADT
jgi:hypothetical protein